MSTLGPFELNTIVTGDARELMRGLPDDSIDILFTSPPYNVGKVYETTDDRLDEAEFWQWQADWIYEAYRVTNDTGRMFVTVGDKMLWPMREAGERAGWKFHQLLVWIKTNISAGSIRISCDFNLMAEWCLLFHRGRRTPMLGEIADVNTFNWIAEATTQSNFGGVRQKVHPAQMAYRVAFSWLARTPGAVVLDPFMGSGTTAMACKALGKSWLGFEIGEQTAQNARERVAAHKHRAAFISPLFMPEMEQLSFEVNP